MVFTRNTCSSSGEELPGCPSCARFAFKYVTAGRPFASAACLEILKSYWWLACPSWPISAMRLAARWWGFEVDL